MWMKTNPRKMKSKFWSGKGKGHAEAAPADVDCRHAFDAVGAQQAGTFSIVQRKVVTPTHVRDLVLEAFAEHEGPRPSRSIGGAHAHMVSCSVNPTTLEGAQRSMPATWRSERRVTAMVADAQISSLSSEALLGSQYVFRDPADPAGSSSRREWPQRRAQRR
jgi:hypothetical protein